MTTPDQILLPVLFEDEFLIVIDKPAGLASVASAGVKGRTCFSELRRTHRTVRAVHRLDRETSGVMLFALEASVHEELVELFRSRDVDKRYLALVPGVPSPRQGTIDRAISDQGARAVLRRGGQPAQTRYRVLQNLGSVSVVEARPITGRHNQIRLHFAAIGHPLIGERKYARGKDSPVRFRRVALHAVSLAFVHPRTGHKVRVKASPPEDWQRLLAKLRDQPAPTQRASKRRR